MANRDASSSCRPEDLLKARASCDHLASLAADLTHIPTPHTPCNRCQHPSENWLCLSCKEVLCSRYVNKHMLQHYQQTNHSVVLSFSDLSVWCFSCNAYLDAQVILQLLPVHETAYILKFEKPIETQTKIIIKTMSEKPPHYYLSDSDKPGDMLVSHPLKGTNYSTWRRVIINALRSKHKLVFVNGKLPKPKEGDPEEDDWLTCDAMVVAWLLNSLNEELHNSVAYRNTAYDIWRDLEERFSQRSGHRIQELKRELANTRQGELTISAYYTKIKRLWDQLDSFSKFHQQGCAGCTCGVMTKEKEEEKLHQLLMGLNDSYAVVRSNILCKDHLPSLTTTYSLLSLEEVTMTRPIMEATAFKVHVGEKNRDSNERPKCEHCKKIGHIKENCFEIVGYPLNWQEKKNTFQAKGTVNAAMTEPKGKEVDFQGQANQQQIILNLNGLSQTQFDQLMALLN